MSKAQAAKLYEDFTEAPADIEFEGNIPQPKSLNALGKIVHVVYVSDKWYEREGRADKKSRYIRYIHAFEKANPLLCHDQSNDFYHLIGKVDVRPEGIMDYRGKRPGNTGNNANYTVPKDLTFLGELEEITYESPEDGEDYRIDFDKNYALCSNPRGDMLFIAKLKK